MHYTQSENRQCGESRLYVSYVLVCFVLTCHVAETKQNNTRNTAASRQFMNTMQYYVILPRGFQSTIIEILSASNSETE